MENMDKIRNYFANYTHKNNTNYLKQKTFRIKLKMTVKTTQIFYL